MKYIFPSRKYIYRSLLLIFAFVLTASNSAVALSPQQRSLFNANVRYFNVELSQACSTTGSDTPLVGSENAEKAFNFFLSKGLTPFQVAGILGNMHVESGIEPQRLQGTSPGVITPAETVGNRNIGWGIVQWTPASKFINTQNPISQANDLGVQLQFLWDQLQGGTSIPEKRAGDELKGTKTLAQAVLAFQGGPRQTIDGETVGPYFGYERPADKTGSIPARMSAAKGYLAKYGSNAPPSPVPGGNTPTPTTPAGEAADSPEAENQEWQILAMVNQERQKANLPSLRMQPQLRDYARFHAKRMRDQGNIWHDMAAFVPRVPAGYTNAGENVGMGGSVAELHQALMNSPPHRAAILSINYNYVGMGMAKGADGRLYVSQNFMQHPGNVPVLEQSTTPTGQGCNVTAPGGSGGTNLPTGTAMELARQILANPNIRFQVEPSQRQFMEVIANTGRSRTCGSPEISTKLLGVILKLAESYKLVIGVLVDGHGCDGGNHPKGAAVDINGVNYLDGREGTGNNIRHEANELPILREFYQKAGEILAANGGGGLGQQQCYPGGAPKVPGVTYFNDTCNHLHLDTRGQ